LCYRTRVIDPKSNLGKLLKSTSGPGNEPELAKETEWSYHYKTCEKSYFTISKFLADEGFAVSASEIQKRWPNMDEGERIDFAQGFSLKATWDSNDTEILEIIMQDGNDRVWESCALAFPRHSDRERAVSFLLRRMEQQTNEQPLNYIQALGLLKDRRATPAIYPYYEKYREGIKKEAVTGIPDDVVFGPIPYHAYFSACGALLSIEGATEYSEAIRKYLEHPHPQVRWWAKHALELDAQTISG
jgi:hypothetical protein